MSKLSHSNQETMDGLEAQKIKESFPTFTFVRDKNNLTSETLSVCDGCQQHVFAKNIPFHVCEMTINSARGVTWFYIAE